MPRKNKRAPEQYAPSPAPRPRSAPPAWAEVGGDEVREVQGDKEYRCPGCDHVIRTGVRHLVVVPAGATDERRHWHVECWRRELRRLGRYRPFTGEV
jgi:DNA-directed RNA polymerase subunit RPC12/RpoP